MFADYRVPQTLNYWGILKYSPRLTDILQKKEEIPHGNVFEMEIRAATVVAVERLGVYLQKRYDKRFKSIDLDWFLWQFGENHLKELPNHHRVLSIYY